MAPDVLQMHDGDEWLHRPIQSRSTTIVVRRLGRRVSTYAAAITTAMAKPKIHHMLPPCELVQGPANTRKTPGDDNRRGWLVGVGELRRNSYASITLTL